METFDHYASIVESYKQGETKHSVRGTGTDYVNAPRSSGYRGFHFVLDFQGDYTETKFHGLPIEIQLRTAVQHSWATAVESVGIMRGEELKSGQGDHQWLRLFSLMGSEYAEIEGTNYVPGTPTDRGERHEELKHLNNELHALKFLGNLGKTIRVIPPSVGNANFAFVSYDTRANSVSVNTINAPKAAAEQYFDLENGPDYVINVLVEIEKVRDLRHAFPNYFGNVEMFTRHLNFVINPENEYEPIEALEPVQPKRVYDLSWLRDYRKKRRK